ncbi:MAG: glycosyltransferase [Thermoplasmatales archaeon]
METDRKGNGENIGISVVITAYNRTKFLSSAIESVLKQEKTGTGIEIIVISNVDFRTDGIPQSFNLKKIIMEGTIGEFLSAGIESASGEIIAFLDDDDIWMANRIERLESVFSDMNVIFYHSMYSYIDSGRKPIKYVRNVEKNDFNAFSTPLILDDSRNSKYIREAIKRRADFNLSCIAVRKKLAMEYIDTLKLITSAQDGFFFWTAVMSGGDLFIDNLGLIQYRVHHSNVSGTRSLKDKANELQKELRTFELLARLVEERVVINNRRVSLKKWLRLYYDEYMLILLTLTKGNKTLILKSIISILETDFGIRNTLKYRITGFGLLSILNTELALFFYDHLRCKAVSLS